MLWNTQGLLKLFSENSQVILSLPTAWNKEKGDLERYDMSVGDCSVTVRE